MSLLNVLEIAPRFGQKWSESHGRVGNFLGAGMLYFALPYMLKSEFSVCLGSGATFVPRLMCEAQVAAGVQGTVGLVDANTGPWGRPIAAEYDAWMREFPSRAVLFAERTENIDLQKWGPIGYLHVDADHTYEGALADLRKFAPKVRPDGLITCHDTNHPESTVPRPGVDRAIRQFLSENPEWTAVHAPFVGVGTAILGRKV